MKISAVVHPSCPAGVSGLLLSLVAAALLSGCASSPSGSSESPTAARPSGAPAKLGKARKGGGYYLNDGPGDRDLSELAAIPDAVPRVEPLRAATNRPYSALGQDFVPMTTIAPYKVRGIASWYGTRYHGSNTSSGEVYDMYGMTAAHPTLPIPSYVKVTNLATGRAVIVRVNDRGPFAKNRVIDLSFTAAWKLGYTDVGSAEVEVESILPQDYPMYANGVPGQPPLEVATQTTSAPATTASATPAPVKDEAAPAAVDLAPLPALAALRAQADLPSPAPANSLPASAAGSYIQFGAWSSEAGAQQVRQRIGSLRGELADRLLVLADGPWYRLQAGPYPDSDSARRAAQELNGLMGLKPIVVKR